MYMRKILIALILLVSWFTLVLSGCAADPYRDYLATGLEVKGIGYDYEDGGIYGFGAGRTEIFTTYADYSAYSFPLDYTESYFERNDLLVFIVSCCSSDGMEFGEILQDEGRLYPLFYRNEIGENEDVTCDIIVMAYCAEIPKSDHYGAGEIIYRYR